jgi:hypothetical protein
MGSLPELHDVRFDSVDRLAAARAAIALASERFSYPLQQIELVVGTHRELPNADGAAEVPPQPWSWRLEADQMHFVVDQPSAPAMHRIFLAESALVHDEKLACIAAHEVAHLALAQARLRRTGREDEEITDLATVVAGYGALFVRHRYVEQRRFASGGRIGWRIEQFGTLSKPAIAFAREWRRTLSPDLTQGSPESAA